MRPDGRASRSGALYSTISAFSIVLKLSVIVPQLRLNHNTLVTFTLTTPHFSAPSNFHVLYTTHLTSNTSTPTLFWYSRTISQTSLPAHAQRELCSQLAIARYSTRLVCLPRARNNDTTSDSTQTYPQRKA